MATDRDSSSEKVYSKTPRTNEELAIINEQIEAPEVKVSYGTLFRYATAWDIILIIMGSVCAIAAGSALPLMTLLIGSLTGSFSDQLGGAIDSTQSSHNVAHYSVYFIYLAIGEFFTAGIALGVFAAVGEHITLRIREEYVKAVLRQNIGYFDKAGAGEVSTRASSDINLIQDGISEKVSFILTGLGSFVSAVVVSFIESWKLALIVFSSVFALVFFAGLISKFMVKYKEQNLERQGAADNVVEEAISSVRNVTAFGAQQSIINKYDAYLRQAEHWNFLQRAVGGFLMGISFCIIYAEHALSFWQGSRFLVWNDISVRAVIVVQLAIMMAGAFLGQALPHIHNVMTAVAAGKKVFAVIDRKSPIDPQLDEGTKLDHIEGEIELRDIVFAYPSRPEVTIFDGLNFTMPAGKTTAIAGPSGGGKSTVVGLIERFYKPIAGTVIVDGHDVTSLNIRWWRQQIALVSQEPVLFSGTIFENIEYGLIGTDLENNSKESKLNLIVEAAKTANAHEFITSLPAGYDTEVGDAGRLLSGGQKQRIAIARAVVSNPKILLLDEATSNLDAASEAAVQTAIERAAHGRTTMIIAHKLSMVHNADKIVVVSDGKIVEQGSHADLAGQRGIYADLLQAQNLRAGSSSTAKKSPYTNDGETVSLSKPSATASVEKEELTLERSLSEKHVSGQEENQNQKQERLPLRELIRFVWTLSKEEKWSMLMGAIFSVFAGTNQPLRGIFFAYSIRAISWPRSEDAKIRSQSNFWAGMFFMLGLVQLVACTFQGLAFARSSSRLVRRAQRMALKSILSQGIPFFDRVENSAGSLTGILSAQASQLTGVSGATIGAILVFITTVFSSIAIALGWGWKLSLVGMSVMPLLIVTGFVRFWLMAELSRRMKMTTQAGSYLSQSVSSIRTVTSLTMENVVMSKYRQILIAEALSKIGFIVKSSSAYAFGNSFLFLATALGFWYGGKLVSKGEYDIIQFFICFTETMFGAQAAGAILSFAPEVGTGRSAVENFKRIIETRGVDLKAGEKVKSFQGTLEFRNVNFRYPERPAQVLKGVNLTARMGSFTAIVGQSGSGKSTTMALIERFYEPTTGSILVDGQNISELRLAEYRNQMALVSQETTLYDGTVRENLVFGRDDIGDDAVEEACRSANIYDFIISLPDGFNTLIGPKGSSLSGGQRQRIAIARALLREPKILLLDEATSALDSTSEEVVEQALRTASKGRTTIAIAHRLSSIQHADVIYVLDAGRVVESGTHTELLALNGKYSNMVTLQSLEAKEQ